MAHRLGRANGLLNTTIELGEQKPFRIGRPGYHRTGRDNMISWIQYYSEQNRPTRMEVSRMMWTLLAMQTGFGRRFRIYFRYREIQCG